MNEQAIIATVPVISGFNPVAVEARIIARVAFARNDIAAVFGVIPACLGKDVVLGAIDAMGGGDYEFVGDQGTTTDNV